MLDSHRVGSGAPKEFSRQCPSCRSRVLRPIWERRVEIDACLSCGGLWFDAGELALFLQDYDRELVPTGKVIDSVGPRIGASEEACPGCGQALREHELSLENSLPVAVCPACEGVWLRHGELARAQAGHHYETARVEMDGERSWGDYFFQFISALPVEFNFEPRRRPYATGALMVLICVVFLYQVSFLDMSALSRRFGLTPVTLGEPRWFVALFTHLFLHADFFHIAGNLYFLYILGDNLEDLLGVPKYLALFLLSGLASGLTTSVSTIDPELARVGSSGAISGLLAAYAVFFRKSRLTFMIWVVQFKLSTPIFVAIWVLFNIGGLVAQTPGVAWESHLGGFAFGLIVALLAYHPLLQKDPLLRLLNGVRFPVVDPSHGRD